MATFKTPATQVGQLDILVLLRGFAVIMVCFCHFAHPLSKKYLFGDLFECLYEYGKYGVHVFFVISGFVIPLSFLKGKYNISDYTRFLYKRVLRLHPPYLFALALTLVIIFLSYRVRQIAFPEDTISILKSLVYFHAPIDNPVFWTLAIEAQYYLFIGLFYSLLIQNFKLSTIIILPILVSLSQTYYVNYIPLLEYIPFFFIGTIGFLVYSNIGDRTGNMIMLILLLLFSALFYEVPAFIVSLITIILILQYKQKVSSLLQFPGKISYSIYLIHFPIGVKLINFIKPKINPSYNILLLLSTTMIIFAISWVFYKFFEEFSEDISRRIKYKAIQRERTIVLSE